MWRPTKFLLLERVDSAEKSVEVRTARKQFFCLKTSQTAQYSPKYSWREECSTIPIQFICRGRWKIACILMIAVRAARSCSSSGENREIIVRAVLEAFHSSIQEVACEPKSGRDFKTGWGEKGKGEREDCTLLRILAPRSRQGYCWDLTLSVNFHRTTRPV